MKRASPRIAIKADGGGHVGLGHLSRCLSLAQAWKSLRARPVFLDVPPECRSWVRRQGFPMARLASGNWDILLADSYSFTPEELAEMRRRARLLVGVDDFGGSLLAADYLLCSRPDAKSLEFKPGGAGLLLGPKFHPMRRDYWKQAPAKKLPVRIERCLITMGGGKSGELGVLAAQAAARALPGSELHLVLGPLAAKAALPKRPGLVIHKSLPSLKPLLLKCDAAVSAGGQTLYELAWAGMPAVAVSCALNQEPNLAALEAAGSLLSAGKAEGEWEGRVENLLRRLDEDLPLRKRLSRAGRGLVDGRGALRAAGLLLRRLPSR